MKSMVFAVNANQKDTFAVDDFGLHSYLLASRVHRRAYEIVSEHKIADKLTFLEVEISCVRIARSHQNSNGSL